MNGATAWASPISPRAAAAADAHPCPHRQGLDQRRHGLGIADLAQSRCCLLAQRTCLHRPGPGSAAPRLGIADLAQGRCCLLAHVRVCIAQGVDQRRHGLGIADLAQGRCCHNATWHAACIAQEPGSTAPRPRPSPISPRAASLPLLRTPPSSDQRTMAAGATAPRYSFLRTVSRSRPGHVAALRRTCQSVSPKAWTNGATAWASPILPRAVAASRRTDSSASPRA